MFSSRNGFCEHYASAFVVMLRAAAIPARVVTGYLGGEMNGNYMIVRQSDAHAWAEAYLDGRWVRFDPTGAVAPARVDTNMAAALGDGEPVPMMALQQRIAIPNLGKTRLTKAALVANYCHSVNGYRLVVYGRARLSTGRNR